MRQAPAAAAAALLTLTAGCVTINGMSYPSGTRFAAEVICQPQVSSENLRVVVKDSKGNPIPRAKVRVIQEPVGGIDSGVTNTEGAAAFSLGSDAWQVSVWFPGYYSGTVQVQIGAGQICGVTFYLRFNDRIDPGLFFCTLEDDAETTGP